MSKQKNKKKNTVGSVDFLHSLQQLAYGGVPNKLVTPEEITTKNNIDLVKATLAGQKASEPYKIVGNTMIDLGANIASSGMSPGIGKNLMSNAGGILRGLDGMQQGDYTGLLSLINAGVKSFGNGGPVKRDENGNYISHIKYDGIQRPIKIKSYRMGDKDRYYVFSDYDKNEKPLGATQRRQYLDQLKKNNPDLEFFDGDNKLYANLRDDNNWDFQDRYSGRGNWWTGVKGGDERFFQKDYKSTPTNAVESNNKYKQLKGSKNRDIKNYMSPEDIIWNEYLENKSQKAFGGYAGEPPCGVPGKPPCPPEVTYDANGNKIIKRDVPMLEAEYKANIQGAFGKGSNLENTPGWQQQDFTSTIEEIIETPRPNLGTYDKTMQYSWNPSRKSWDINVKQGIPYNYSDFKNYYNEIRKLNPGMNFTMPEHSYKPKMAYGGLTEGIPIEAEGQELIETPDGIVSEIMGASHENGGVDMIVPEDSKIYSKRVKGPNGDSMAKRKEFRTKHLDKLQKLVELHPNDKILKKTLEKTKKDFDRQDKEDLLYMQHQNDSSEFLNEMMGFNMPVEKSFATGGYIKNYKGKSEYDPNKFTPQFETFNLGKELGIHSFDFSNPKDIKLLQEAIGVKADGVWGKDSFNALSNYANKPRKIPTLATPGIVNTPINFEGNITYPTKFSNTNNTNSKNSWKNVLDKTLNSLPSMGDAIGMYGAYKAGVDPKKLTLEQRAGDTPNINPYENYGKRGLEQMELVKDNLDSILSQAKQNIQNNTNTSRANANANARGINTLRAMNLAIDANQNQADNQAFLQYAQQLAGVDQAIAQMLDRQDQMVMQGEAQRDLADRQDRDNFYTQLQRDTNTENQMYQQLGSYLNRFKERDWNKNMYSSMTNVIGRDANGNQIRKDDPQYSPMSVYWNNKTPQDYDYFIHSLAFKGYKINPSTLKLIDPQGNEIDDNIDIKTLK